MVKKGMFLIYGCFIIVGISGKSQILFALTYTTRYLDLLTNFVSVYNTFMKVIFLAASYATLWLIYMKFRATYDQNHDTFRLALKILLMMITRMAYTLIVV